jgi:trk system potassium uptake protein TrkA
MSLLAKHHIIGKSYSIFDNYEIIEVQVPKKYLDKPIKDIDIRSVYNINILMIKQKDKEIDVTPEYKLTNEDVLLIFGRQDNIKRFIDSTIQK